MPDASTLDSAGVTIHELPAEALTRPAPLALAATPSVRIGEVGGQPEYQWTRPVAGARLSDGGFAVLEQVPAEVRLFDAGGSFVRRIGRSGEGPGEFQRPSQLAVLEGDTVLVWDEGARRLSWFSPDGALLRDRTLRGFEGIRTIRRVRLAESGTTTVLGTRSSIEDWGRESEGRSRERWTIAILEGSEDPGRRLGEVAGTEQVVEVSRSESGAVASVNVSGRWWWGEGFAWAHSDGVWTADRLAPEARHFDFATGLDRIVRIAAEPRRFTSSLIDSLHRVELDRVDDPELRDLWREDFEGRDYPESVPHVSGVFAAADGSLWLGLAAPPPERLAGGLRAIPRWLVVPRASPDEGVVEPLSGDDAGVLQLPSRSHPLWADAAGLLLVRRSVEFDVPFVEWYPLVKPSGGQAR